MLRGTGTAIALPLLEAMMPKLAFGRPSRYRPAAKSIATQPRMICCYISNGVNVFDWFPPDTGPNWTLTPTLRVLEPYKSDFTLLSGLGHPNGYGGHDGADVWLTGADLRGTPGTDYQNSVSVDQIVAAHHGRETRFPSLELGNFNGTGSAGHSHTLAFNLNGIPLPAENSPQRLLDRLFVADDAGSRKATLERYAERRSILDEILSEANSLHRELGKTDQRKLTNT